MSSPFIFIATNRVKPGQLDRERKRVPSLVEFIGAKEPRLIAFNEYVNESGDGVTVVQIHPDTASMEAHMGIVRERAQEAYAETLDATARGQVFGQPSDANSSPPRARREPWAATGITDDFPPRSPPPTPTRPVTMDPPGSGP